jgi:hypothetical protein
MSSGVIVSVRNCRNHHSRQSGHIFNLPADLLQVKEGPHEVRVMSAARRGKRAGAPFAARFFRTFRTHAT